MKCNKNLLYPEIFNVYIKEEDAIVLKKNAQKGGNNTRKLQYTRNMPQFLEIIYRMVVNIREAVFVGGRKQASWGRDEGGFSRVQQLEERVTG